jgi:tRNA pseudouridine55 synthase
VPSAVSAIKVGGVRAYKRVRQGESVDLVPRSVTVSAFDIVERRGDEVDVHVVCSSGTYVRALARDLGAALGVGAHLTALRRTRVGSYDVRTARRLDQLAADFTVVPLDGAIAELFPRCDVDAETARRVAQGQRLALPGVDTRTAVFAPDGTVVALVEPGEDGSARTLVGFVGG